MLHWVAFVFIGVIAGLIPLHRGERRLVEQLGFALAGSLLGGFLLVRHAPPSVARYGSLVTSAALAALFPWSIQTGVVHGLHAKLAGWKPSARLILVSVVTYGLVACFYTLWLGNQAIPTASVALMETRHEGIKASLSVLKAGGPPLAGMHAIQSNGGSRQVYYPVGVTDDPGIYYYVPILAYKLGANNPLIVTKWLFIASYALLVFVYPLVSYLLFRSYSVALLSPIPLMYQFRQMLFNSDIYWVSAWVQLLCLPILFVLAKRWKKHSTLWLFPLMIVASFASSIRINAGMPVLLAAVLLALVKVRNWLPRLGLLLLLVFFYLSIQPLAFNAIRSYRDHVVGDPTLGQRHPTVHPIWHNVYIGLGYVENSYGIRWDDSVTMAAVKRVDPNAAYLSQEYEAIARQLVLSMTQKDPAFVARNIIVKFGVVVQTALQQFWGFLLAFLIALAWGSERHELRTYALLTVPGLLLGLLPPILTVPYVQYELGWLGAIGVLWLLGPLP